MRATDIVSKDLPQLARVEAQAFYTALGCGCGGI